MLSIDNSACCARQLPAACIHCFSLNQCFLHGQRGQQGAASPVTLDDHLTCHSHLQYAGVCVVCVYTCVSLCSHGHCNHHNRIIVPIGTVLPLSSSQEVFRFACSFNNGLVRFCCCFYLVSFKTKIRCQFWSTQM